MPEIEAKHEIKDGIFEVTTVFKVPEALISSGVDLEVAKIMGYTLMVRTNAGGAPIMIENPQHPIDFILDKFHEQLQDYGRQVITNQATQQAKEFATQQFNQLLRKE